MSTEQAAKEVREMRDFLMAHEFAPANAVGELRRGKVWVATGYVMGEYTVTVFLRPTGAGVPVGETRVRLLQGVKPGLGLQIADHLVSWCEQDDEESDSVEWPTEFMLELANTR